MLADWTKPGEFKERTKSLDKTRPVYTYCLSGSRSHAATLWLKENGFNEVYNLQPGIIGWRRANLPLESLAKVDQITMEDFNRLVNGNQPVLVDIGAVWCPPCKKMEPYLSKIAAEMPEKVKIVRVNADDNTELCKAINVSALPVLKLYKNNEIIWESLGFVEEAEVRKQLLK